MHRFTTDWDFHPSPKNTYSKAISVVYVKEKTTGKGIGRGKERQQISFGVPLLFFTYTFTYTCLTTLQY